MRLSVPVLCRGMTNRTVIMSKTNPGRRRKPAWAAWQGGETAARACPGGCRWTHWSHRHLKSPVLFNNFQARTRKKSFQITLLNLKVHIHTPTQHKYALTLPLPAPVSLPDTNLVFESIKFELNKQMCGMRKIRSVVSLISSLPLN